MSRNGMELVRRDQQRVTQITNAIGPFIPQHMRSELNPLLFLRAAALQLEGVDFDPSTLLPALLPFALSGLLPLPALGYGYLIPYGRTMTGVVGVRGYIELARRATPSNGAKLLDAHADCVLVGDEWDMGQGIEHAVAHHRAQSNRDPRKGLDQLVGAYAVFRYVLPVGSGTHEYTIIEWMEPGEVLAARPTRGGAVWKSHPLRMASKTVVRRACQSGRIALGYLAGSAVTWSARAEHGDVSGSLQDMRAHAVALPGASAAVDALDEAIDAVGSEAPDDRPGQGDASGLDRYLEAAAPFYAKLDSPACTLAAAHSIRGVLAALRKEHGVQRDERAEALIAVIEREAEE